MAPPEVTGDPCKALQELAATCTTGPTRRPECDEVEAKLLACH
jgi:hypothetical protein